MEIKIKFHKSNKIKLLNYFFYLIILFYILFKINYGFIIYLFLINITKILSFPIVLNNQIIMRSPSKSPQRTPKVSVGRSNSQSPGKISGNKSKSQNVSKTVQPTTVQKFLLEKCTTLVFIKLNGEKIEKLLDKRVKTYTELQREISRYTKNSKRMFTIRDNKNEPILATAFTSYDIIKIKEIGIKPNEEELKHLDIKWDIEDYNQIIIPNKVAKRSSISMVGSSKNNDDGWDD